MQLIKRHNPMTLPNKSLDAAGGTVVLKLIRPAVLD